MDSEQFRESMSRFTTGVTVVATTDEAGAVHGMTANAFTSVSLDPPLVLVCVGHARHTHEVLKRRGAFSVSVLASDQADSAIHLASQVRDRTRDGDIAAGRTPAGVPYVPDCLACFNCLVVDARDYGDHTVFVARVLDTWSRPGEPLVFFDRNFGALRPGVSSLPTQLRDG